MANKQAAMVQAAVAAPEFRLVAKFTDADGSKLVVLAKQVTSGEFEASVKHQVAGEKRSLVGLKSSFTGAQKAQATAKFTELCVSAEKAGWKRDEPKAKKAKGGFDVMPAAVAKK